MLTFPATTTGQAGSSASLVTATAELPDLRDDSVFGELGRVGAEARARALRLAELCEQIRRAGRGQGGLAVERCGNLAGLSPAQMQRLYLRWKKDGVSGLINRNKAKPLSVFVTPAAFREWWAQRQLQPKRGTTVRQLWLSLLKQLKAWEDGDETQAIPGYSEPPRRNRRTGVPEGWVYETLSRIKPSAYARKLSLEGAKAASAFLPSVRTTREGVPVLGCVMFDDEMSDITTAVGGQKQATRPVAFHSLDMLTGTNLFRQYMPVIVGDDGARKSLTQDFFYWIVAEHLCNYGYRTDAHGTVLVAEHGTASIGTDAKRKNPLAEDPELEQRIISLTGGKVRVDRSGIYSDPAVRGLLYPGPSSGNPRYKAPLEVFFRLLREATAVGLLGWDGHTGRHRDQKPEELPAIERAHAWWMKLAESMPQSHRQLLMSNILSWREFVSVAHRIIEELNSRTDHHLANWEACGFMGWEALSPNQEWLRAPVEIVQQMPAAQIDLSVKMGFMRPGRLSPREALARSLAADRQHIRRLPRSSYHLLLPQRMARVCTVTKHGEFVITDWRLNGDDPLIYIAECSTVEGLKIRLNRGESYQVWLNPFHPDTIMVCHASGSRAGAAIGECVRTIPGAKTDNEALARQCGVVSAYALAERDQVARAMEGRVIRRQTMDRWNKTVAEDAKEVRKGKPSRWASADARDAAAAMEDLLNSRADAAPAEMLAAFDPLAEE